MKRAFSHTSCFNAHTCVRIFCRIHEVCVCGRGGDNGTWNAIFAFLRCTLYSVCICTSESCVWKHWKTTESVMGMCAQCCSKLQSGLGSDASTHWKSQAASCMPISTFNQLMNLMIGNVEHSRVVVSISIGQNFVYDRLITTQHFTLSLNRHLVSENNLKYPAHNTVSYTCISFLLGDRLQN